MPTTVRPDEHDESMVSSAVTPSSAAPYPVLVGTATTGAGVNPPTTLANAPSMPAITTTASAMAMVSISARSRCSPATPQSTRRVGSKPSAVRTATHSVATGKSAVPAVITATVPGRCVAARNTTVANGPLSETVPGPWPSEAPTAETALTCASVALVNRTGPSVAVRSSSTTAAQCSGVLPGPYTASGMP